MSIYSSKQVEGIYQNSRKMEFTMGAVGYCTPYVSTDGQLLVFAAINDHLDLYQCKKQVDGNWSKPKALSSVINRNGQGNPYLTPDSRYLLYASENNESTSWSINWVSMESLL